MYSLYLAPIRILEFYEYKNAWGYENIFYQGAVDIDCIYMLYTGAFANYQGLCISVYSFILSRILLILLKTLKDINVDIAHKQNKQYYYT